MGNIFRSRGLAIVVGIVGLVLFVVSAFADSFGIGEHGFGWKQTVGVVVGAVLLIVAAAVIYVGPRSEPVD